MSVVKYFAKILASRKRFPEDFSQHKTSREDFSQQKRFREDVNTLDFTLRNESFEISYERFQHTRFHARNKIFLKRFLTY